jgi:hypothetical protein
LPRNWLQIFGAVDVISSIAPKTRRWHRGLSVAPQLGPTLA